MQVTIRVPTIKLSPPKTTTIRTDRLVMWLVFGMLGWATCGFTFVCLTAAKAVAEWKEDQAKQFAATNDRLERSLALDWRTKRVSKVDFVGEDVVAIDRPEPFVYCRSSGGDLVPESIAIGAKKVVVKFEDNKEGWCAVR